MSQKLRAHTSLGVSVNWALKAHLINFTIVSPKTKGIKIEQQKRTLFTKKMETFYLPREGYSIYPWMGRCGAAPHTLTLFKTYIADFPTLFKTEFRFLIPCLRHLTRNQVNINKQELVKILLFIVQVKISCLRQKLINRCPD